MGFTIADVPHQNPPSNTIEKLNAEIAQLKDTMAIWVSEAARVQANISVIQDAIKWIDHEKEEAEETPHEQAHEVRLLREKNWYEFHCCLLIREYTMHLIKKMMEDARGQIDPRDTHLLWELNNKGSIFLRQFITTAHNRSKNIEAEKRKSAALLPRFAAIIQKMLTDPEHYKMLALRETAKMGIEYTYRQFRDLEVFTPKMRREIETIRSTAIMHLDAIPFTTPMEVTTKCWSVIQGVNKEIANIEYQVNLRNLTWHSGMCGKAA